MVSVVVIVKNEEKNIVDCLDSLRFSDEIVVVDDDSTDRTSELLEKYQKDNPKLKVFKRTLDGDFTAQRNFGLEKTSHDWVLFIDADERVTKELSKEITDILGENLDQFGGFLIPRTDYMWGKELKYGETGKTKLLRLLNKKHGKLTGTVHERWETDKKVETFINPIKHFPHPTIAEFLEEINFYTDLRAAELYKKGVRSNFISIVLYTKGKFIYNYFIKLGFLDGTSGLIHAVLMSFHSFLVRGKLWLLWQKKESA